MSPLGRGWHILTSALDGAPSRAQPWSLPGPAPAMPKEKLFFLASSLTPTAVCCSPAFGTFWTNLAGASQYLAGMGTTSQRPLPGTLAAHQALPNNQWQIRAQPKC